MYDFGACDAPPGSAIRYIVMELAEGETLARHLRAGPLDWQIAVRVCAEVCAALAAAHLHGVVHRDIKPANVILTPYGAKVLDFGISVMSGNDDVLPDGNVVGTPAFMAPERFGGVAAAPRDRHVRASAYCCTSAWPAGCRGRRRPTRRGGDGAGGAATPLPAIPGLPVEVAELCLACLDADPERRPTASWRRAAGRGGRRHDPPAAGARPPAPDEPAAVSPWTRAAAEAATNHAVEAVTDRAVGSTRAAGGSAPRVISAR